MNVLLYIKSKAHPTKVLWMSKKDYRSTSFQSSVARVDIRNGSNEWRMRDRFGAIALLGLNLSMEKVCKV